MHVSKCFRSKSACGRQMPGGLDKMVINHGYHGNQDDFYLKALTLLVQERTLGLLDGKHFGIELEAHSEVRKDS